MQVCTDMKRKILKLAGWLAALTALAASVWLIFMPEPQVEKTQRVADGEGVEIISFAVGNKKQIRIKARLQRNAEGRDRHFEGFEAEIEPKSAQGEVFHAFSDHAYLFNNEYNIELNDNVRIESKSLLLTGPHLLLKDKNYLTGKDEMSFRLNQVSGKAKKGLNYNMLKEIVKLFDVDGVMDWEGSPHTFRCRELTVTRTAHRVHFLGDVFIEGAGKKLVCQRMAVDFDDAMKETKSVLAVDDVQLISSPSPGTEDKNRYAYKAGRMLGIYQGGLLRESELHGTVELDIDTPSGHVSGRSESFRVRLDEVGGFVKQVEMPGRGEWSYQGERRNFQVTGNQGRFDFDDRGELAESESNGQVDFKLNAYSGQGDKLIYKPKRNLAVISGPGTWIRKRGQLFHGKSIEVDTARNALQSGNGVTSSVTLKKRPPFSAEPVMIRAATVDLEDRQGSIRYTGSVEVTQEKLKLRCQDLYIADQEIVADRDVLFSFQEGDDKVLLTGAKIRIVNNKKTPKITVEGKARLIMAENQVTAGTLTLNWTSGQGLSTILADKPVHFQDKQYQVDADKLEWDRNRGKMRFTGTVTVDKGRDFRSKGEEVELDTRTQQLRILSRSQKR